MQRSDTPAIWLASGYHLATAAAGGWRFLATPRGRALVEDPATATAVAQIREKLADLE